MGKLSTAADVAIIAGAHALACLVVRAVGFDNVSDDDFARVTIAQAFAHAPRLDPSGTSWLPFPFWILGTGLAVIGRSLVAARALSIAIASVGAALPYFALRDRGVDRKTALLGIAFAFVTPWAIWSGAATVPESLTASLTAAAVIGGNRWAWAITLACLSRYEPWPIAAVLALAAAREKRWSAVVLCVIGPILWMAWNAHAHDGPLHFFRRVSNFKRAIGDGSTDTLSALVLYPKLLFTTRPEVTVPALLLLRQNRKWLVPLLCVGAQVAFLAYGNARDGAPAHHAERALLGSFVILALFVAAEIRTMPRWAPACIAVLWVTTLVRDLREPPGQDRQAQIVKGLALRGKPITIAPCAYEHFALVAAHAAPETVTIRPRVPDQSECPKVEDEAPPVP